MNRRRFFIFVELLLGALLQQLLPGWALCGGMKPPILAALVLHHALRRDNRDMWAVKGHYFTAYYNWPYTFGLLFGIGLYAEFQRDPEQFRGGYDDLLSATGLGDATTLAARFGIDVADQQYWAASVAVLVGRIDEFEAAVRT